MNTTGTDPEIKKVISRKVTMRRKCYFKKVDITY